MRLEGREDKLSTLPDSQLGRSKVLAPLPTRWKIYHRVKPASQHTTQIAGVFDTRKAGFWRILSGSSIEFTQEKQGFYRVLEMAVCHYESPALTN